MAKTVREVMTSKLCSIDADETATYAAKMMRDEDVGIAPIVEGDRLVGVLTDRDIAVRVVAERRDPEQAKVSELMSLDLVTLDPDQDLDEGLRLMARHQVRRLPVVEEDGRLVGILAQADVAKEADDVRTGEVVEQISR
jgi:CBS domain-containing protein